MSYQFRPQNGYEYDTSNDQYGTYSQGDQYENQYGNSTDEYQQRMDGYPVEQTGYQHCVKTPPASQEYVSHHKHKVSPMKVGCLAGLAVCFGGFLWNRVRK